MNLSNVDILGTQISVVTPHLAVAKVLEFIKERKAVYVCVAPVSTIVDGYRDINYRAIINKAHMVTPDGMPVVWVARYLKNITGIARTYGPDLMRNVCSVGQSEGVKHYLFGSSPETLALLVIQLKQHYPGINIVGSYSPAFKPTVSIEEQAVIEMINQSKADIVWVGLGSPKQDKWMALNRPLLEAPVLIGIGAAFDFISGVKPQAPKWLQQMGLEWLFRLCCEPKRLWKRYVIGNTIFIFAIVKELFTLRKS